MKFINHLETPTRFERFYNEIREEEGRLLSLEQIRQLPYTKRDFQHHHEWNRRIRSTERILNYLRKKPNFSLLDLGCGNGWFLFKLSTLANELTGVDINLLELEQAREILNDRPNTSLHYGDIFSINFQERFDFIVLNGSVQYFPSLQRLFNRLIPLLTPSGEIHIIDSPFYPTSEAAESANKRSKDYYESGGVKAMSEYYHHHTLDDLKPFRHEILYNPHSLKRKLWNKIAKDSPLYWIKVGPKY